MRRQTTPSSLLLGISIFFLFVTACTTTPQITAASPTDVIEPAPTIPPTVTPQSPSPEAPAQETTQELDVFGFNIVDENGTAFDLAAYKGTPLMLVFFSVRCGHCHHEAEDLESLYTEYKDQINMIALEVSGAGNAAATEFANTYGLTFPVTSDFNQELTRAMEITGVPTNLLIFSDGTLYDSLRGYRQPEDFAAAIDQLLQAEED